jgi:hypothetical protein
VPLLDRLLPGKRYTWHRDPVPASIEPLLVERRIA